MDDSKFAQAHVESIKRIALRLKRNITIMEICGGHTNVIMKYGIRDILPKNIRLISGPGCPVCVTAQRDLDCMIELAHMGVPIATYGDMMRVPGTKYSLDDARAKGAKIFEVYSAVEVLKLKETYPEIVFFGIGFETTTPMSAFLLEKGITVYSVHKLVPPAMKILINGEIKIDGFLDPGHVTSIIGIGPYKEINIPQTIAGFSPERILRGIMLLVEMIADNKTGVINAYPEIVKEEGNPVAIALMEKHLKVVESDWRGLGMLPASGLDVRNPALNARVKYKKIIDTVAAPPETEARCGDVLKGLIEPPECPLYKHKCNPLSPQGACMVSEEGACSIAYRYGR